MKHNKVLLPLAALSVVALSACDDNLMEWGTPEGHYPVTADELPLSTDEKIANYAAIKEYVPSDMQIGLGLGADKYISDTTYRALADANFQCYTTGNAMKMDAIVGTNGNLTFTTVDQFLALVPSDIQIYGHNFVWHTQQKQDYLKKLIAPTLVIEQDASSSSDVCENVVTNYGFTTGDATGYTGLWGKYTYAVEQPGADGDDDYCIHFTMTDETSSNWDSQLFWTLDEALVEGVTYAFSFEAKSDANIDIQFLGQNSSYAGIYKDTYTTTSDWVTYTGEFEYDGSNADIIRVGFQFGGTAQSNVYIDNFKFGVKKEDPMENVVTNYSFSTGDATGYTGLWGKYTYAVEQPGYDGDSDYCIHFTMTDETAQNWDCQLFWALDEALVENTTYAYTFDAKSDANIDIQIIGQNASYSGIYKDTYTTTSDWTSFEGEFTYDGSVTEITKIGFQFGGTPQSNVYIDNFKFGVKKDTGDDTDDTNKSLKAATSYYVLKTADEKKEALDEALEAWIKGCFDHYEETGYSSRFIGYDVINEPISDDGQYRGIDGKGFMDGDTEPEESTETGLTLNWEDDHFYWGYYMGMDYATKAFEYAHEYAPSNVKLFVNDYNLETSPGKLAKLIEFVNYIDQNNETGAALVDGIGTQMHVTASSITEDQVDAMFQTLAATGKIIRVTELDVALDTSTPSEEQLQTQSDVYQMIIESYLENIPSAQRSGVVIWGVSDAEDEHEYWLPDDAPNLFDANYQRKTAYKGVCDALAGRDVSEDFTGDDWVNAY